MVGAIRALAAEDLAQKPAINGAALLDMVEKGRDHGPLMRARLLAQAAGLEPDPELGTLARRVWALRASFAPPVAEALAGCAQCGAKVEFTLPAGFAPPLAEAKAASVDYQGQSWRLRLPRLSDIGPGGLDPRSLCPDAPWSAAGFLAAAETALEQADGAIRISFALTCPDCATTAAHDFDTLAYVWVEAEQAARTLVQDVVALARAFGWAEADILAMSPTRRRLYRSAVAQ